MKSNPYKDIINTMPEIVYEIDPEGYFTYLNQSIQRLNYKPDALIGSHYSLIIHPDDIAKVQRSSVLPDLKGKKVGLKNSPKLFDERRSEERLTRDLNLRIKDGLEKDIFINCTVNSTGVHDMDSKNNSVFKGSVGYIKVNNDDRRTEELLLLTEKHYRLLIENLTEIITIMFFDGTILFKSDSIKSILGYDSFELIGENEFDYIHEDDIEDMKSIFFKDNWDDNKITFEHRYRDVNSEWRVFKTNVKKVLNPKDKTLCFILNSQDITELKEAQNKLIAAKNIAVEANEIKNKMISLISHDLRGPLGPLKNIFSELNNDIDFVDKESLKEIISGSSRSIDSIMHLIDNLADWGNNLIKLNLISLEIIIFNELIEEIVSIYKADIDKKEIVIEKNYPPNLMIESNKGIVSTVIRNLLSNAIKFTPHEGLVTIAVSKDDLNTEISIKDTGVGFNEEDASKIFDINKSRSSRGTDGETGSGLGLFLCKDLMKRINGEITIEGNKGKGSLFKIKLPHILK